MKSYFIILFVLKFSFTYAQRQGNLETQDTIEGIIISGSKTNYPKMVGYFEQKISRKKTHTLTPFVYNEFAVFINDTNYVGNLIKTIKVNLRKGKSIHTTFRVRLYTVQNNLPYQNILSREITFSNSDIIHNQVTISIETMKLCLPKEGVFISIQPISFWDTKNNLARNPDFFKGNKQGLLSTSSLYFSKKTSQNLTYTRRGENGYWALDFFLQKKAFPLMFGLELD